MPFSAIAFLSFIAALRTLLVDPNEQRSETFSRVQLAAGILFVAGAFVAAATASAAATSIEFFDSSETDPALLRQLPQLGYSVMFVFTIRMAGMFIAVTSRLGRWLLPGRLTVIGYLLAAVLLLTVSFSALIALVFPAWVVVLCAWLLLGRERRGAEAVILSHHGNLEHGSPVVPATREATLVHMMDNLGGKLGSFDRIERALPEGESWSRFDRGIDAAAFFGSRAA